MKPLNFLWGLPVLLPLVALAPSASAQCVVADVAIQAAITGSEEPAEQTNDVDIESDGSCVGNTSVSTNRQIQVGETEPVRQERQSRHRLQGDPSEAEGSGGPTVTVPVEVQVDVYNPAERLRR